MTAERLQEIMGFHPYSLSSKNPYKAKNYVNGSWRESNNYKTIIDPLSGDKFITVPDT
jgi:1-pyrroline-5-carboxylate dehydrogenase